MATPLVQKKHFVVFNASRLPYVMLFPNLMMVQREEVLEQESEQLRHSSTKSAAPANTVTKKYKKLCEMLQSARKKKRNTSDASYGIINLVRSQNFAKNILKE